MYLNVWICLIILFILYTLYFCAKKEFFEQPKDTLNKKRITGTKYTLNDVNTAVDLIKEHFLKEINVHVTIIQIISVLNSPQEMKIKLFIYNPVQNFITGYTVSVKLPLNKKNEAKLLSITKFSEKEEKITYNDKNVYQSIDKFDGFV